MLPLKPLLVHTTDGLPVNPVLQLVLHVLPISVWLQLEGQPVELAGAGGSELDRHTAQCEG
jgi:hypothetical protein